MSMNAITSWYAGLAARDQRILRIGAVAVALILLAGVLLPLQGNLRTARQDLQQQREDLEWMRGVAPTLAAAGPGQAAVNRGNESLVVTIDRTARESGLAKALTGSTPSGNGAMRVQLENADFNLMLGWMHRLATQQGIVVEEASITRNGGAGQVNVSALLRPGN